MKIRLITFLLVIFSAPFIHTMDADYLGKTDSKPDSPVLSRDYDRFLTVLEKGLDDHDATVAAKKLNEASALAGSVPVPVSNNILASSTTQYDLSGKERELQERIKTADSTLKELEGRSKILHDKVSTAVASSAAVLTEHAKEINELKEGLKSSAARLTDLEEKYKHLKVQTYPATASSSPAAIKPPNITHVSWSPKNNNTPGELKKNKAFPPVITKERIIISTVAIAWAAYAGKQVASKISQDEWNKLSTSERCKKVISGIPKEMLQEVLTVVQFPFKKKSN